MHNILAVSGTLSPGDMHYYVFVWVKLHVPHGFRLLKLVQVILKLLGTSLLIKAQVNCSIVCKQADGIVCLQASRLYTTKPKQAPTRIRGGTPDVTDSSTELTPSRTTV